MVHENKSEWNHLIGKLISCSYYSSQHPALCKQPWKPMYLQVLGLTYSRSTDIHNNWHSAHSPSKNGVKMLINFIPELVFRNTIKVMCYYYSRWKLFGCTSKVDLVYMKPCSCKVTRPSLSWAMLDKSTNMSCSCLVCTNCQNAIRFKKKKKRLLWQWLNNCKQQLQALKSWIHLKGH